MQALEWTVLVISSKKLNSERVSSGMEEKVGWEREEYECGFRVLCLLSPFESRVARGAVSGRGRGSDSGRCSLVSQ